MIFVESVYTSILRDKKVCFLSLGCKVNAYETEVFRSRFEEHGAVTVSFEEGGADIVVINTCSVTNIADRKSRQMLHRARKLSPDAVIVAAGCYVQAVGENAVKGSDADAAVGNERKDAIVEAAVEALLERNRRSDCVRNDGIVPENETAGSDLGKTETEDRDTAGKKDQKETKVRNSCHERTRAFIKVTDGCNQFCAYCIIPYVRGRVRSRSIEDVVNEVAELEKEGYKEVVITGIHLSSYGVDFPEVSANYEKAVAEGFSGEHLLKLIDEISGIQGIERIRLGSLEPRIITEDFMERIKNNPKVCPHFHLSLQSGSDSVLKRMKRHYGTKDYENACSIIREAYYQPSINTDIIVGFPGETGDEFMETVEFAKKIGFAKIHIFKYSRRKGTLADKMPDQITEEIKNERSSALGEIDIENHRKYISGFIGKHVRILTEQEETVDGKTMMTGLTERYVKVAIDHSRDGISQNTFVECEITGVSDDGILIGRIDR
ncbi:MAG: tRNA (N(6)-L-threonylcarbamoyladenosine(37)-C(2))-methylthiotransferase MtaB [Lachnospiraceae bacterium]|nr:tRNA (N(6)-L-threonylcarbamoyladenosine(37)-C(2))-methylthiotransferase MtaB [Lachnospiraceae bacterium]